MSGTVEVSESLKIKSERDRALLGNFIRRKETILNRIYNFLKNLHF